MVALTWDQARGKVRGDLWRPGTTGIPDDVCDRALHAALQEIEQARRFLWLENIAQTVAAATDTAVIPAPPALRSISSIAQIRDDGSMDDALSVLSLARVRIMASETPSNSYPSNYALSGGSIYLDGEVPTGTMFEVIGIAGTPDDLPTAVAAGPANPTLQLYQSLVIAGACRDVALTYLKNDAEAVRQGAAFDRRLERLTDREDEQRGDNYGGCIVPDTGYQDMAGR